MREVVKEQNPPDSYTVGDSALCLRFPIGRERGPFTTLVYFFFPNAVYLRIFLLVDVHSRIFFERQPFLVTMPSSSMRKKPATTSTTSTISRPSLIDTMLLTSTPLRRCSPARPAQSTATSTRSATNLTLQHVLKEKNQGYEDMQLFNLAKNMNKKEKHKEKKLPTPMIKKLRKRSRSRKPMITDENHDDDNDDDDDDEIDNEADMKARKKTNSIKRKTKGSKEQPLEEPHAKKQRRTAAATALHEKRTPTKRIGRAASLMRCVFLTCPFPWISRQVVCGKFDACTSVEEENQETRLIEQSKLYIEGPGSLSIVLSFVHTDCPSQEFDRTTRESMHTIRGSAKNSKIFMVIYKLRPPCRRQSWLVQRTLEKMSLWLQRRAVHVNSFPIVRRSHLLTSIPL